jgi:hypothetical protein
MAITGHFALAAVLVCGGTGGLAGQSNPPGGWISLFDGKSLKGWKETQFRGHGAVSVRDDMILIGKGHLTGITWTEDFPQSGYEIRFEAARLEGSDFFAGITFPVKDSFCSWINGGWGGEGLVLLLDQRRLGRFGGRSVEPRRR